ncbi:thermonuclease family protein [Halosimplex pelagicum]|uniref:Thermonuclease family protein n=1 Tax=Halosimplex pelagicum TaxID=869886 RepID=A0A7D5TEG6_9EURY|nr:thermonuclease family protein [Halosimplex pelagicum]QLH84649.1 thermonuclease family protein [Halosimplex pelagicum]
MSSDIAAGATHRVEVVSVTDGDTVDVRFEGGTEEEVRLVGIDTPETEENRRFERIQEWPGIGDPETLVEYGERASAFARERLAGETVTLSFDPSEPTRGTYGRLLGYLEYEADGERVFYNREVVAEGYARAYHSGVTTHDALARAEADAREAGRGLWAEHDPESTEPVRDAPVEELFVPRPSSVRRAGGPLGGERAPVRAEPTATQEPTESSAVTYDDGPIPLVGVDREARVGVVGGLVINEAYEATEGFEVDTSEYGTFPFLTNLLDWLADREGEVLIDGGHGGFGVDYALSAEDAAYYRRYLEGQGLGFVQRNRLGSGFLDCGRALVVTPPVGPFGPDELDRVRAFRDDGGSVVLLGSGAAPAYARANLNAVAAALGSDLRLNADEVRDAEGGLDGDERLVTTARFDRSLPLFGAFGE